MLDYFLYINVKILSFFICVLPIGFSLFWARLWGTILYYILYKRARICSLNLKLAFGGNISLAARKKITRQVFQNLAMNFTELLYFPRIDENYIKKYVRISGREKVENVSSRKKGLIFLTAHFGNWELSSLAGQVQGYPMVVLARQQKLVHLNSLLNSFREKMGSRVIIRGKMMRDLLTSLRNNKVVGILGDQKAGTTGILVEFFNRLAWTPTGAITLARHTGAGILPVFMIRERGPFHRIEIKDELSIDKDDYRVLGVFNQLLEEYIRKYPSQWLWFHRRWKASPNKNILILSDGKAGHLNQAKAVAEIVTKVTEEKIAASYRLQATGYRIESTDQLARTRIVEIKFKNALTKVILNLSFLCCVKRCTGCLRCLKLCLERESFERVSSFYADMVISCGGNLAALNLILAEENQAKSIAIMKPGLIPVKKFDLAIIPAHDRPRRNKNVVVTQAALNLINEKAMKEGAQRLQASSFQLPWPAHQKYSQGRQASKSKIGVLIGGESKNYTLTKDMANILVDELLKAARDLDARLLVTTSRRTPLEADKLIKERLSGNERCSLLVIANEQNIEGAVGGILGLSHIVVVSGESISMISEALSSARPVVVFEIGTKGRTKDTKHKRFLENLVNKNYLTLVSPQKLCAEIERIYHNPRPVELLRDRESVREAIRNLI